MSLQKKKKKVLPSNKNLSKTDVTEKNGKQMAGKCTRAYRREKT